MEEVERIKEIERINGQLTLKMTEMMEDEPHTIPLDIEDNWVYLASSVCEILQFLQHKFPDELDIMGSPIQATIFQNMRYNLGLRIHKKLKISEENK